MTITGRPWNHTLAPLKLIFWHFKEEYRGTDTEILKARVCRSPRVRLYRAGIVWPWLSHPMRQDYQRQLCERWKGIWKELPRFPRLRDYAMLPSKAFLPLLQKMQATRAHASLVLQLRTGHIALGSYLQRIRKVDDAKCSECGAPQETVTHYLLKCPAHVHERMRYFRQWRQKERDFSFLLTDLIAVLSVIGYVCDTEWLRTTFGELRNRS